MKIKKKKLKKFYKFLIKSLMEKFKQIFLKLKIIVKQKNIIKDILKRIDNETTC